MMFVASAVLAAPRSPWSVAEFVELKSTLFVPVVDV